MAVSTIFSLVFLGAAGLGGVVLALQTLALWRHRRVDDPAPHARPPISILKPLCGVDDELWANLESFAALPYPDYEVLLGIEHPGDRAFAVARAAARRWPGRMRVVLQEGAPGLNPKVNQLVTLARAARHDLLVVSDSNVSVGPDYLDGIAGHLERPEVGLVTHPIVGAGGRRLGSRLDNLHLTGTVAAGVVAAQRLAGKDIVVGKSMALRRGDLDRLGGFERVRDVLAEDYVLGGLVGSELGLKVAVARRPVRNVSCDRSVGDFLRRYARWSVMHRRAVGAVAYAAELLLNPVLLAGCGALVAPSARTLGAVAAAAALRVGYEAAAARLGGAAGGLASTLAAPLKELLIALAWVHGWLSRTVVWREHRLIVRAGTRLAHARPRRARRRPFARWLPRPPRAGGAGGAEATSAAA